MTDFRPCVVIPTYNNPLTIRAVVMRVREHVADVLVVDDGSDAGTREVLLAIAEEGLARVERRASNGGKGAAVKDGLCWARDLGYSHALQVDADGQHQLDDIPRFLAAAEAAPRRLVLGYPVFDETVPSARLWGRKITVFWTTVETAGRTIRDPMCGFRVYPLPAAVSWNARGDFMDFDPEIAVRAVWAGVSVVNLPTQVRYLSAEEGAVSHFALWKDNLRISWMHTRLVFEGLLRFLTGRCRRRTSE